MSWPSVSGSTCSRPLAPDVDHLAVEVAWAARQELALGVADVMVRRTRLAQELPDRGAAIAPRVAEILGAELGWTKRRRQDEVTAFLARAHHDFDVPAAGGTLDEVVSRECPFGDIVLARGAGLAFPAPGRATSTIRGRLREPRMHPFRPHARRFV